MTSHSTSAQSRALDPGPAPNRDPKQTDSAVSSDSLWRSLLRSPTAVIGVVIVSIHLAIALAAPWIAPYSPTELDPANLFGAPSWAHPFGADQYGRDVFSRVLLGGRLALSVSIVASFLAIAIGGFLGVWLGYSGGLLDDLLMRVIDTALALPGLLLLLTIITVFGGGWGVILAALAVLYIPGVVRIVRAATLEIVPQEYITAARVRGERTRTIIWRELMPNIRNVLLVEFAMRISWSIVGVSGLAFLGFGVPTTTPDWGLMIAENRRALAYAPWCTLYPIMAISSLVIGVNLAIDGLANALGVDRVNGAPQ